MQLKYLYTTVSYASKFVQIFPPKDVLKTSMKFQCTIVRESQCVPKHFYSNFSCGRRESFFPVLGFSHQLFADNCLKKPKLKSEGHKSNLINLRTWLVVGEKSGKRQVSGLKVS